VEIDEAIAQTQRHLSNEGLSMADLLTQFRDRISPTLIGESNWQNILRCATNLPIESAALPFGFELPLHDSEPIADLGVSLARGTKTEDYFQNQLNTRNKHSDSTVSSILRLFAEMGANDSTLEDIVGPKVMLEYDIGSGASDAISQPGMFLRPGERPILGANVQGEDVTTVVDALVSCVGWEENEEERLNVEQAYLMQPADTRMDSFGVFPSRSRSIRLAIMGFKTQQQLGTYLHQTNWPGEVSVVDSVIDQFRKRANIERTGINIDVQSHGLGPTLGLTLIVKQRYTKDSRYWLDGLTDWEPFLKALSQEAIVVPDKLEQLAKWVSKPTVLFAKSTRYVLLQGIHHIKLVVEDGYLQKVKAYVFLVLSAGL